MRHGTGIDDPVVLTIIESIHHHLRRSLPAVFATILVVAAMAVALVAAAGNGVSLWVPAVALVLAGQTSRPRYRPQLAALRRVGPARKASTSSAVDHAPLRRWPIG